MSPYTISFVDRVDLPMLYTPKWWDKPRWWLVRKLGGSCPFDTVRVTRIPIDGGAFAERLFLQQRALFDTFGRHARTILMGSEDYAKLMNAPEAYSAFSFASSFNYDRQVFGLTVRVIPWMRGIVVMPAGEDL